MFRRNAFGSCPVLFLSLALIFFGHSAPARAQCAENFQDISFNDGIGRIKTYECRSDDVSVQVVFHRIDEEVIGSLILNKPRPEVAKTLGSFRLQHNDVYAKLKGLFDTFGVEEKIRGGYGISLSEPDGGTEYTGEAAFQPGEDTTVSVLSLAPNGAASREAQFFTFPTLLLGKEINDKVKAAYAGGPEFDAVLTVPDDAQQQALEDYFARQCSEKNECGGKNYLDLARHVNRGGFLRVSADVGQCEAGEEPTGYLAPRQLELELVTIRNTSGRQISLDHIVGSAAIAPVKLHPGQAVAIPLGMEFTLSEFKPIRYGRKLSIRGMQIDGKRIFLLQMLSNFISQTSGDSGASCPYLYALNADGSVQQSYGKVIHSAHNRYRKMTEVVQLKQFTTHFMLREEEPERSFIDQVELRLRMKDKSYLRFAPKDPALGKTDSDYTEIAPFTAIQIAFELPDTIKEEDVERATLAITGYYRQVHLPAIEVSVVNQSRR